MRFAKNTFLIAGLYGLAVLAPQYFLEDRHGRLQPPAITHPEYYYGFVGVGLAWQVVFLIIARDPLRYQPLMPAAVLEKVTFVVAVLGLFLGRRAAADMLAPAALDAVWGALFVTAYLKTAVVLPALCHSAELQMPAPEATVR